MKTRSGFVSNSSSSSFCILGIEIDQDLCGKLEGMWDKLKKTRVRIQYAISSDEGWFVGINATSIGDDETPRQVKQELIDTLHSVGVDLEVDKVDWYQDGGYNG